MNQDIRDEPLFAPMEVDENNEKQKAKIDEITQGIKNVKIKNPNVDFSGMVAGLRSEFGDRNIEQSFNMIGKAWEKATGKKLDEQERQDAYTSRFGTVNKKSKEIFEKKENFKNESDKKDLQFDSILSIFSFLTIILFVIWLIYSLVSEEFYYKFKDNLIVLVVCIMFMPSIICLKNNYKRIPWVKETIDDLYKLLKDIIGNGTVQKVIIYGIIGIIVLYFSYVILGIFWAIIRNIFT